VFTALLAEGAWTLGCGSASAPRRTSASSIHHSHRDAGSRIVGPRRAGDFCSDGHEHNDIEVGWSVSGVPAGARDWERSRSGGVYTAPADLPSPATVLVTATSHAAQQNPAA